MAGGEAWLQWQRDEREIPGIDGHRKHKILVDVRPREGQMPGSWAFKLGENEGLSIYACSYLPILQ